MRIDLALFISILLLSVTSCGENQMFWDISKFSMDPKALASNQRIHIIYSSNHYGVPGAPEFYYHIMAEVVSSGDTVNILSYDPLQLKPNDVSKEFVFLDMHHNLSKMSQLSIDSLTLLGNDFNANDIKPLTLQKVARDPQFDYIADNDFPTVIGICSPVNN